MITQPGDGTDASGCACTRVSDADRERAIDVLKAAFGRVAAQVKTVAEFWNPAGRASSD